MQLNLHELLTAPAAAEGVAVPADGNARRDGGARQRREATAMRGAAWGLRTAMRAVGGGGIGVQQVHATPAGIRGDRFHLLPFAHFSLAHSFLLPQYFYLLFFCLYYLSWNYKSCTHIILNFRVKYLSIFNILDE